MAKKLKRPDKSGVSKRTRTSQAVERTYGGFPVGSIDAKIEAELLRGGESLKAIEKRILKKFPDSGSPERVQRVMDQLIKRGYTVQRKFYLVPF